MNELKTAFQWLQRETELINFGVIGLSVVIHDGRIKRIDRTITEKEQVTEEPK